MSMVPGSAVRLAILTWESRPAAQVMVRQALWVGIFAATVVWLNYGQVLDFGLAMVFLTGFIGIEIFLRIWERSRWRP